MRRLLITILLASAASSPAVAQQDRDNEGRPSWGDRQESHPERQQSREERSQAREQVRAERSNNNENHPQFKLREQQSDARQQQIEAEARARFAGNSDVSATARGDHGDIEQNRAARQRADGVSRWTRDNVQQAGETSRWTRDPNQRAGEAGRWTRDRTGWTSDHDRVVQQQQPQVGQRSHWANGWNRNWRNDRRYDWHGYRNHHRSVFHLGIYVDPFNYGYRPFSIGYRLQPLYYGERYWIDPAIYSLPYPPPGTQWVRYWNDALLVDMYTGEVVDVIQNFFW